MTDETAGQPLGARRAVRTSGGVIAGRVVGYVGSLLTLVATARELGSSGRGAVVLIVTVTAFASILCTLGLPVAARLRLVASDRPTSLDHFLGLAVCLLVVEALVAPAAATAFLVNADVHVDAPLVAAIAAFAAAHGALYVLVAAQLAYGRLVQGSFSDAVGFLLQGVFCGIAAIAGARTLTPYVVLLGAALLGPVIASLVTLRGMGHPIRPRVDRDTWHELTGIGVRAIGTVVAESATFRVDRLVLGAFAPTSAVGVYSVAATAAEMVRFVPASVSQLVFYATVRGELTRRGYLRIRRVTLAGVAAIGAGAAMLAPAAISATVGSEFAGAVTPFRILVLAELGCAVYVLSSSRLNGAGHLTTAAKAAAAGLAAVLVADLALIPGFRASGAAWASVLAYVLMGTVAARALARRDTA